MLAYFLLFWLTFVISNSKNQQDEKLKEKKRLENKFSEDTKIDQKDLNEANSFEKLDFSEQWSHLMIDYDPDYTVTFNLPYLGKKVFYEDVSNSPTYLSGGYMHISEQNENKQYKVHFKITDPKGNTIIDTQDSKYLFSKIIVTTNGKYTISFLNMSKKNMKLSFTLEVGSNKPASSEHIDLPLSYLIKLEARIKQLKSVFKFKLQTNNERFKSNF